MPLKPGTRLGPYEITAPIGAGGMGEVYRAKDTKLRRDVAIKVLPEDFAQDRERLARFEREAHLLASLNHPNIASIYGLEESDGSRCLVLELVEGETLAERIVRGPLSSDEALPLFIQMAEGLEAAHQKGILHRDFKPANVKITPEGKIKILDFGLAKELVEETSKVDSSMSPTITRDATRMGIILGTAAYMSPEQAKGKQVDSRTDIFAFGAVLFEMLTGKKAFPGDDISEVLASVIKSEPNWNALPASTPRRVRELVEKCLRKDRARRLQHVGDGRIDLEDAGRTEIPEIAVKRRGRHSMAMSFLAGLLTAVMLFWAAGGRLDEAPSGVPDLDLRQLTANPVENTVLSGALSPDGKYLAYADLGGLTVRLMETGEMHPVLLPGDLVVDEVDWFPDGTTLLLGASSSALWKTSVFGSIPRKLADLAYRAAVSPAGEHIAYLSSEESPSRRVYVTGPDGQNRALLVEALDRESFWELSWSPDGNWLLFGSWNMGTGNFIEAVRVGTGERKVVLSDPRLFQNWRASLPFVWTPDGRLVYGRRELPPNQLTSNLWSLSIDSEAVVHGEPARVTQLTGVNFRDLSQTADGRRLAFLTERNQSDVYVHDLHDSIGASRRLTVDERDDYPNGWFPGAPAVLLNSNRTGAWNVYRYELEAATPILLVSRSGNANFVDDGAEVSDDGAWILYDNGDVWMRAPIAGGPGELVAPVEAIQCAPSAKKCIQGERDTTTTEYVFSTLDPLEGRQDEVARIADNPPFTEWDLSPDGERVAIVHNDGRIRIVELVTGVEHVVTNEGWWFGEYVSFAADGKAVFVDGSRSGRLATTRKSLLRVSLGPGTEVDELRYRRNVWHIQPQASPDGRFLAFAAMTFSANAWMIEGF